MDDSSQYIVETLIEDILSQIETDLFVEADTDTDTDTESNTDTDSNTNIRNKDEFTTLTFSGGAYLGIYTIGAMYECIEQGIVRYGVVDTVYGISVGSIVALLFVLGIDRSTVENYITNRPWNKVFNVSADTVLNIVDKKGLYDENVFYNMISPILEYAFDDGKTSYTMRELYEKTGITMKIYATSLDTRDVFCFSHSTTPDEDIVRVLYLSSTFPFAFIPSTSITTNEYYVDGGLCGSNPIKYALADNCNKNNILSFSFRFTQSHTPYNENTELQDYIFIIIKMLNRGKDRDTPEVPNTLYIPAAELSIEDGINMVTSQDHRKDMILKGHSIANEWIISRNS